MMKKLFKFLALFIIVFVCGMLFYRIYALNTYPPAARGVIATDALRADYADGSLAAVTWEPRTLYDNGKKSKFFSHQPIYFPETETLIVTIRYNNSLLPLMAADFGFEETNGRKLPLDVSLYADGFDRIAPTTYTYTTGFGLYSYRRYVFEGVSLSAYESLYLDVYYAEDADYAAAPYASLEIYDSSREPTAYKLTSADKKALK